MRALTPVVLTAATVVVLSAFVAPLSPLPAVAAEAAPADAAMKPVALTQKQVEGALAAQKDIREFDAKQPDDKSDKPDPKAEAKLSEIVKKYGFADVNDYTSVIATISQVVAGIDPETKTYIGPTAVLKKQIAEVQADTKMPAKEKKETLDELNAAAKTASSDKPSDGNIAIVSKNFDALAQAMESE